MRGTHRTSVTRIHDRKFRIEVHGFDGKGVFFARTWDHAFAIARKYARIFDAPCRVI